MRAERPVNAPPEAPPTDTEMIAWRTAPVFAVDLADDPLEERPRLLEETQMTGRERELLAVLKGYWEAGIVGPRTRLPEGSDDEDMLRRLRDLGYTD
jgi:hypothetical protein